MIHNPLSRLALHQGLGLIAQTRRDHLDLVAISVEHAATFEALRDENTRLRAALAEQAHRIAEMAAAKEGR